MAETLLNYAEAAARLRIKPDTLRRWVASGRVPHLKYFNKRVFFTDEHLEQIIATSQRGVLERRAGRSGGTRRKEARS